MDAFEKEWSEFETVLDSPRDKLLAQNFFRAGMRAAGEIADAEDKDMTRIGMLHPPDSESRDRCFAMARSAQNIKSAILAEADK